MDITNSYYNQFFNICLQIFGPLNKKGDQEDLMPGVTILSILNSEYDELEYPKENGISIIDQLTNVKTTQFKTTHNTEKHNIIKLFNPYVLNQQPIAPGIYMVHNLILYDTSHTDVYYIKPITFFVECSENQLKILDDIEKINFI